MENVARLVGSLDDKNMGRVEVCVGGSFRRASSIGFNASQAAAVCKQLGQSGSDSLNYLYSTCCPHVVCGNI